MSHSVARGLAEVAEVVVDATLRRPPSLGPGRLLCVDGRAGSGKSTLAEAVATVGGGHGSIRVIHLDDLLDGWDGLAAVSRTLDRDVLTPLRAGRPGRYRRYDWDAGRFLEAHRVDPVDLLVVEGVSAGASTYSSAITTLVWVEAPPGLRLARGLARDGEQLRPQWLRWMREEDALFARERTRDRADLVVDGTIPPDHPGIPISVSPE